MKRVCDCCFTSLFSRSRWKQKHQHEQSQRTDEIMEKPTYNAGGNAEIVVQNMKDSNRIRTSNIILNHNFSEGLHLWHPNCCNGFVIPQGPAYSDGISEMSYGGCAVITNRKQWWQGLEQDITARVSPGSTYAVSACVGISGPVQEQADIMATLKLEYRSMGASYLSVGRISVSKESWGKLEGTFSLSTMPDRVVFYLEGPSPGIDLLIKSVQITNSNASEYETVDQNMKGSNRIHSSNIILNRNFSEGLHLWHPNCCDGFVVPPGPASSDGISEMLCGGYAVVTNRKQWWQGLEQDITARVSPGSAYAVSACVGVSGPVQGQADIMATLKLEYRSTGTSYLSVGRISVSKESWGKLEGTFSLSTMPDRVVFYLEGPSPGIDLLIKSVQITNSNANEYETVDQNMKDSNRIHTSNIILNHDFSEGLHLWHPNCCDGFVVPPGPAYSDGISKMSCGGYAVVTNRKQWWQGLEQDITARVSPGSTYAVSAYAGVSGPVQGQVDILATLKLEYQSTATSYLSVGRISVSTESWGKLEGTFSLSTMPDRVVFYLEGPSPGINLLIKSVQITNSNASEYESVSHGCVTDGDEKSP